MTVPESKKGRHFIFRSLAVGSKVVKGCTLISVPKEGQYRHKSCFLHHMGILVIFVNSPWDLTMLIGFIQGIREFCSIEVDKWEYSEKKDLWARKWGCTRAPLGGRRVWKLNAAKCKKNPHGANALHMVWEVPIFNKKSYQLVLNYIPLRDRC